MDPTPSSIKVANGSLVPAYGTFKATLNIANEKFTDTFLLLKTMNQTILGHPFFEKYDISLHPKSRTLKLPNLFLQLSIQIQKIHTNGKISAVSSKRNHFLRNNSSLLINTNTTEIVQNSFPNCSYPDGSVAIIETHAKFENHTGLCVTSALITLKAKQDVSLATLNVLPHKVTARKNSRITILTPKQAEYLQPINPQLLSNYFNQNINALIQESEIKVSLWPDEFWFPTPENCSNPESLTGIETRLFDEIVHLKKEEKLDPISNALDKQKFLAQFPWKNSVFNSEQKRTLENLL